MDNTITNSKSKLHWGITNMGLRALWDFGGGGGGGTAVTFLPEKFTQFPNA